MKQIKIYRFTHGRACQRNSRHATLILQHGRSNRHMIMNGQGTDGFKKALRKDASIRCSIPSSKTLGLNLVIGSALKKSRCSAVTMEGTRSCRSACVISHLDWANKTVFEPRDFPTWVRPSQVMECWRIGASSGASSWGCCSETQQRSSWKSAANTQWF